MTYDYDVVYVAIPIIENRLSRAACGSLFYKVYDKDIS